MSPTTLLRRATVGLLVGLSLLAAQTSSAGAASKPKVKTLSGELKCRPNEKLVSVAITGTKSGTSINHVYPADQQPLVGRYELSEAIVGETIKVELRCTVFYSSKPYKTSFSVGRGGTRHVCTSKPCGSRTSAAALSTSSTATS